MANNGTGVQIPVIIDIDQACQDAAARVKQAMAPLQRQLSNTQLHFDLFDALNNGSLEVKDLVKQIQNVKRALRDLAMTGGTNSNEFKTLLDAKIYLEDMLRATKLVEQELKGMEGSMAGLNSKLQASRTELANSALGSPEWKATARDIQRITAEMAKWEAKMKEMGMASGSLDKLRSQLSAIEQKYNGLSKTARLGATGEKLLQKYKQITAELEKEGKTLSQIIAEEQKRNQLVQRGAQNRRYEQFAMSNLAKTMAGLRQQAQFLQAAMDRTVPNTAQWNAYKAQLEQVNQRMNELTGKTKQQKTVMDATNASMQKQSALWAQLRSLAGMYLSVFGGLRLLKNIRETTAQFELQQVALGAVIQDTQKATSLFKQLKAAALESPFEIKDLVSYTKQLAAYQIETDKLFDTTKRLADVSAGLGVDMGRLILAYGQVRAAAVLRGQELRQFTEAGVPLVNKLAEKFSQLRGEMVSTGEVFELISKRAVPFSMISEIFEDMTEKGGIFYDMQRKQSYTLYGQWQKLKDAASLMYDEMGNTGPMRKAMEGVIQLTMYLMRNWQGVVNVLKGAAVAYLVLKMRSAFIPQLTRNTILYRKALQLTSQAQIAYNNGAKNTSRMLIAQSLLLKKASTATTGLSRAWYRLQAAMAGNWITLILGALAAIASHFLFTQSAAEKLRKELDKIGTDASLKADQSVRNFERLAGIITDTTKSAAEQNEAMKELQRTYGDIIPAQKLQRDYLQGLNGDYRELTQAIAENIQMEAKRQKIDQITEAYSKQINRKKGQLRDSMIDILGFSEDEVEATFIILDNAIKDGLYDVNASAKTRAEQFKNIMIEYFGEGVAQALSKYESAFRQSLASSELLKLVQGLAIRYKNLKDAIQGTDDSMAQLLGTTGKYAKQIEDMEKEIADVPKQLLEEGMNPDDFEFTLQSQLRSVNIWKENLEKLFKDIDISDAFRLEGRIDFAAIYKAMESAEPQVKAAADRIRKAYEKILPTDSFVDGIQQKFQKIAESQGASMNDLRNYLMSGEDDIEGYVKKLKEGSEKYAESIKKMNMANAQFAAGIMVLKTYTNEEVKAAQDAKAALDAMLEYLKDFDKKTTPKGSHSYVKPKFITDMEESIKFMKDFKKGYDELSQHITRESALNRESEIMKNRGTVLGMDVEEQKRAATDLLGWYRDQLDKTMAEMKKSGGRGNTLQDLLSMDVGKNKKLKDYQELLLSLADAITDLENADWDKKLEKALSDLADKVKRSEAAKKFYESIFDLTGDKEMAMSMSLAVYGDTGKDLEENIRKQLETAFVLDSDKISKAGESYDKIAKEVKEAIASGNYGELDKYLDFVVDKNKSTAATVVQNWQKRNEEIASGFAKLALKFDELEQQRVNITNKAAKERETVEKGVALEILGIEKEYNAKIEAAKDEAEKLRLQKAKENAIAEAKARGDILLQGITRDEEYELYKLTRQYRLFFTTVGVLSKESARKVYEAARKMLTEQFAQGQMSLARYRRELAALDDQMKKNNQSQNLFVNYLTGGVDGLVSKIKDYSEGLQGIVATMAKNKEDGRAIFGEGDKEFIDKMGKIFGGKVFGVSGRKDVFKKMIEANKGDTDKLAESLANAASKIAALGEGFAQGVAIADLWVQNIGNAIIELDKLANTGEETQKWWSGFSDFVMKTGMPFGLGFFGNQGDSADRFAEMNEYAMQGFEKFKSGNFVGAFADTIRSWGTLFGPAVRTVNRQIKEQKQLLDELTYEYGRLDVAIDKAFGESYIYNYNKQLENLAAQQAAYLKQAELERSKGKKKDKDKIKDYEDKARETADKIADMQTQLSEFFTDTDLTSAAEDFANAWIEAYKEFANTTGAMREKFEEMIKSMITRSLAAKLMQSILQPLFDQIDAMAKDGDLSAQEISEVARVAPEYVNKMNEAMTTMANDLAAAGYNLRGSSSSLTGISRNIAEASEESILGLSAAINTQNFYISRIPSIDEKMSQIIALMGGSTATGGTATGDAPEVDLKLQYLSYLPTMASDVNEILINLKRVISPMGANTATHYIAIR